ncbi:hypothetical protein BDF20DRAFT_891289 [Mycotypha africana]|uniref:uncharacterized protein n=1 Tax=Mycotypha africana TaxID=64632 RepID=UPI0023006559|nr:uncharacterized protein BDF20DRAFT_891289 [Mycotypha africana]KAI8970441.1 hypothetical protein BDF20DRAFT_891289 [Mycotypha africana]
MSLRNNGYDAIPSNDGFEEVQDDNRRRRDYPTLSTTPGSFAQGLWDLRNYKKYVDKFHLPLIISGTILSFILLLCILVNWLPDMKYHYTHQTYPPTVSPGISTKALQQGIQKCRALRQQKQLPSYKNTERLVNQRTPNNTQPILLRNAIVWDGEGQVLENVDIFVHHGVIVEVKQDIKLPSSLFSSTKIIDVQQHIVSPGIVDMHTHLGVDSWPSLSGTNDVNEGTNPTTPFVRSIDAFNPSDEAIRIVASGGITTALVLPGSANLIGGEAYVFKLRPVDSLSSEDMLVQTKVDEATEKKWRYMKMACGENAKNRYGRQGRMPSTRMGEAFLFRKAFADAQRLIQSQEDWCDAAEIINSRRDNKENGNLARLDSRFPENLELESLTALLRGQVKLNIHCYQTNDIEAMLRIAEEFDFEISAFHHALEAYKIPDIIKKRHHQKNNITIATFADHWGYKTEAFEASPFAPKLLYNAGIPVAFKSDHPVLNSQHLVFEAAKSTHYGLPAQEAFKAITSVPAKALGLDHRLGSVKVGYDADLVIWDRDPLEMGASPLQVFIDGIPQFSERLLTEASITRKIAKGSQRQHLDKESSYEEEATTNRDGLMDFILTNVGSQFLTEKNEKQGNFIEETTALSIVVKNGQIVCISPAVRRKDDCIALYSLEEKNNTINTIDIQGGYVLPGLISVGSKLGLSEIPSESSTGDGIVSSSYSSKSHDIIEAIDGLKLGGKKLKEAYRGGVLTAVTAPVSKGVIMGVSAAFKTTADTILEENSIVKPAAALHVQIGHSVKSDSFPTISSQVAFLRNVFTENFKEKNYFGQVTRGELPLIVLVNNKDEIASIINLKRTVLRNAKVAIMGGAEAHLLASHLSEADIAVILRPYLCTPEDFNSRHCLTGAPLTNGTAAHILHSYGVKLAIGVSDDGWARNLAWDAGWLAATSPPAHANLAISEQEALKFITTNLQDIFGLATDRKGQSSLSIKNDFVVWSGSPFDFKSRPILTFSAVNGLQKVL